MKKKLTMLFASLFLMMGTAWAQLVDGGVYAIINKAYLRVISENSSNNKLLPIAQSANDYNQLWLLKAGENGGYTLRCLGSGRFMVGVDAQRTAWGTSSTGTNFYIGVQTAATESAPAYYYISMNENPSVANGYEPCAHDDQNNRIVGWSHTADGSQWDFSQTEIAMSELIANILKTDKADELLANDKLASNQTLYTALKNANDAAKDITDDLSAALDVMPTLNSAITAAEGFIYKIAETSQLSNEKYFKIYGERGFIYAADGVLKGTNAVNVAYDANNANQHFAILQKEDKYYLYNVGAKKFVVKSGNNTALVDLPEQPITLEKTSSNDYVWLIKLNGTNMINLSSGHNDYGVYTDYNTEDPGNRWAIWHVGDLATEELVSSATTAKNEAMAAIALYEEADYYTYGDDALATAKNNIKDLVVDSDIFAAIIGENTIDAAMTTLRATEKSDGPVAGDYIRFKNRAKGVYMAATVNDGDMIRKSDDATDLKTLWLVEAGDNGSVKLKNVATNKYVGAIAQSADVKQKESAEAAQFTFTNVADVYGVFQTTGGGDYTFANMNEWWGAFKVVGWEKNDNASQWVMNKAYPLTVVYKFNNEELNRTQTVAEPGTVHTIDLSNLGDKLVDSVEGATLEDGNWVVTVNAVTTVTVTLKEKASVAITGEGKEGTINVADLNDNDWTKIPAGTAWTISMDVENPNGASFNQWGTSIFAIGSNAFPEKNGYRGLQFYLQSSTNGGKLDAVFDGGDHLIDNVTYTGNFSASISYNGGNQLQIKTTNASGTVAINDYTLTNTLAEFSQFAYGLPKGINVKNLMIAPLSHSVDYPTTSTASGNKYTFTSNKILYGGQCNKIRFTLTKSGAYYNNDNNKLRMSFDSFELFDASGKKVELKDTYFSGNNSGKVFANMLDGTDSTYCAGTWASGTESDWFEITLPNDIDLGGAFSFSYVTENGAHFADPGFRIDMSYELLTYTFNINAPEGETVEVTYNNEAIANGGTIKGEFDKKLFAVTNIPGYTWSIEVDEENRTVTLTYTKIEPVENPEAVVALVNRIGGAGTANKFKFVFDPSINSEQETFVIDAEDGKILIKGSTLSALTTGLGWYLNNVAKINIAWNSLNEKTVAVKNEGAAYADLSYLPLPTAEETHTSDAKYRYYLNTCTFGYSMTSWTWTRWQQEIDWMALHGINMPLQLVGLEEVWRTFLTMKDANGNRKYGYSDEEAKAFVAGPAFIAWWAMNNLEGWGGTSAGSKSGYNNLAGAGGVQDDAWYARQKNLAKQIVDAQRALGMQPVIPGWSGMVPTNFADKSGFATRGNGSNWAGDFVRPLLLSTSVGASKYAEIADDYYECLHAVMGESQYYSMDPFHEGGGAGTMADYEYMYAAMEAANPGSQWVIQQWQWSETQKYSLSAVPAGRLIVLDLFSDGSPAFDGYNGYAPQEAVFCAIPNFGGRSGLMGRLQNVTDNYFKFKGKYASIKGIGTAPEAIEQTPVAYDLIYQLPWMNGEKPSVEEWVDNYAVSRYGKDNAVVKEAWSLLRQGPLNYGADGIQGPVEDVWAARPNLDANKASSWGKTLKDAGHIYTPARRQMLIDAVYKLIDQEDELELTNGSVYKSNYMYDLVEFGGAVMADYAYDLLLGIKAAKNADNTALYEARRDAFLQLILDMDAFRGTNLNFRLGKWTQEARDAAGEVEGATTATPDWYEYNNARTILSTWSSPGTNLNDYSYRSWQGLLKDYYYKRWKYYFENNCTDGEYKYFEWNWAHGKEHYVGQTGISNVDLTADQDGHTSKYTREPVGNTVDEAVKMLGKYIIPVTVNGNTHYAYRYLDNDVSNMATIPANAGGTVDLTPYFGELTGIKSFDSDVVEGSVTDLSKVVIKAEAADGAHSATLTLNDGTKLTFYFSMNPKFNGVYTINYKNGNADAAVFVGYNEDKDNANNVGYKLIATGTYSTTAAGDKHFTITPSGVGFNISAQGKYLKAPNLNAWNHVMFSDNQGDAGVYLFEEVETELYKMRDPNNEDKIKYINDYDKLVFGNDKSGKENLATFTITKAETFPFSVSAASMATLCLPFNVVMADGMYAYDLSRANIEAEEDEYVCTMKAVAAPGETLKKGTPVIIQAAKGEYDLAITMDDTNAKGALNGSLLKGNFVSQALTQSETTRKFIFANGSAGVGFYLLDTEQDAPIGANKCWLEWDMTLGQVANSISLRFDDGSTDVEHIETSRPTQLVIYNILGQRLDAPQKGINIINGKKVLIK